jgi:hypothetical protein
VQLLLNAGADPNAADAWHKTPIYRAAQGGHTQAVQLLLASQQSTPAAMAGAARAAITGGHGELAMVLFNALRSRDKVLAAAELADQSLAIEVLMQLQAAEDSVRELEARWPPLQQLVVGVAITHQELRAAAAGITATAATAAVQAAAPLLGGAESAACVGAAASVSAVAAVAEVAPLAQEAADAAAAAVASCTCEDSMRVSRMCGGHRVP